MKNEDTMTLPLMRKATAKWLVENTSLTFYQIGKFCDMHELEVQGIADGEVASSMIPEDPITAGQLTQQEIARCEADPKTMLELQKEAAEYIKKKAKAKKRAKYTPVARRQDKPDAILWILKNHPEIPDSKIIKIVGTTRNTINAIRDKTHWNINNLRPRDPVLLGLCTQTELQNVIERAKLQAQKEEKE